MLGMQPLVVAGVGVDLMSKLTNPNPFLVSHAAGTYLPSTCSQILMFA